VPTRSLLTSRQVKAANLHYHTTEAALHYILHIIYTYLYTDILIIIKLRDLVSRIITITIIIMHTILFTSLTYIIYVVLNVIIIFGNLSLLSVIYENVYGIGVFS